MPNHLANENSPYLLQHADNPVEWFPWGKEALEKARTEVKPIFLSIGYAACHWCHVMAHESFEDPETAKVMNDYFVSIKVDREERPDLDSIYMAAVVGMTGNGGWPMSVFLTPDGEPFFAGTYFPPVRHYNLPSFREVLLSVAQAWQDQRDQIVESGKSIARQLASAVQSPPEKGTFSGNNLAQAVEALSRSYDWDKGGWGAAPKFPQPMSVEFLLRQATRGQASAQNIATHALRQMAQGGMYDVLGGGFARYSTDENWLVPHFEKMLYDNAQLALVYLHAYLLTGENDYRQVCIETIDFVLRELAHPSGGFYSSLDADSDGEEGKYYLWTLAEIQAILQDEADRMLFSAAYGLAPDGNFEGRIVLQRQLNDTDLAERVKLNEHEVKHRLEGCRTLLLAARLNRVRPATDDKILAAWNALMLVTLAEAGRYLGRADYTAAAEKNAAFLLNDMHSQDRLLRSWRAGQAKHNAYLEDYASLILGLLALYQTDFDPGWYKAAESLAREMLQYFRDPSGGFFDTRDDHEVMLLRPKDMQDNATPSGNALAAMALLQLSAFNGNGEWHQLARQSLAGVSQTALRYPTAFAFWLSAMDFSLGPVREIAILGDPENARTREFIVTLWKTYRPRLVSAVSIYPPPPGSPLLLNERGMLQGLPTAYVCQDFVCLAPVTDPQDFEKQL